MHMFLKPIIVELAALERDSTEVQSPPPHPFINKVILLAGTCDLPAKYLMLIKWNVWM